MDDIAGLLKRGEKDKKVWGNTKDKEDRSRLSTIIRGIEMRKS